jgi:hypothetical protein
MSPHDEQSDSRPREAGEPKSHRKPLPLRTRLWIIIGASAALWLLIALLAFAVRRLP